MKIYALICHKLDLNQFWPKVVSWRFDVTTDERPKENFTIYVNFQSAENAIKQIDVYKIMISFEPLVVLAWGDHRLKIMTFESSNSTFVSLGDTALDKIWTPRITISNHATRDQSFNDPGKIS